MVDVAIIGTGISGMGCAHKLEPHANLTLFEKESQTGGHTCTVDLDLNGQTVSVDTGFMVYNEVTYPLLTQLFKDLNVGTTATDMSFSLNHLPSGIAYCGSSINQLFANRRNLLKKDFWRMLKDLKRFNALALRLVQESTNNEISLKAFIEENNFSRAFLDCYLVPMTAAIWSTPPDKMLEFPAKTLIRFMHNHGLLGIRTQHQWRTVVGGSRNYRDKIIRPFKDRIYSNSAVTSVMKAGNKVVVTTENGAEHAFDRVVVATHSDTALSLLSKPTEKEAQALSSIPYTENDITVHSDISVMPKNQRGWASWNYRIDTKADNSDSIATTHYWMNSLQHLKTDVPVFVSLNSKHLIDPEKVLIENRFSHPQFGEQSVKGQVMLKELNSRGPVFFAGAYFRYGFHEDGLMSGYAAANALLESTKNEVVSV